ncbi:MAG: Cof-type HAD-IIB family hydrolase [Tannerellaceae bacterium]|jgi:Cof subfamily protein (haloacid dehalogenase superfamily)|nr:Cof-type HAD-IIB family hydrolase [Tannerellaceae bacterium]
MKYKLLVLDVDGTLLNNRKEMTPSTLATLLKVQQMGLQIVLASGRSTHGLRPIARMLELDKYNGFILSYNGGQIINMQTNELLFERRINPEELPYIEKQANKHNFAMLTYHKDTIITNQAGNIHVCEEAARNQMQLIEVKDFASRITFPPCKCMIVSDEEEALAGLESHLKKRLSGALDVFRSEPYFLEVVPPQINKADTLGVLMEKLAVLPEAVIAIGDGVCDIGMIQMAGLGIAMGNADERVKRCTDYTTAPNEEDGVAKAVEEHIIAQIRPADVPLEQMNIRARHALMGNLGIQYTYASEDRVEATMPVDERTRQPFGILHGGATLALAETVAGLGSMILCRPDEIIVGMQVSGNHLSSAREGDTVRAVGTIIHKGRSSHVWNVDVFTSTDKLVSSIRVVNSVFKKR